MAARKTELDAELERLHGLPLGEFTAARNALAKRLKKAGNADEAAYVQSLPKPTVSAWAVNVLFQRERERMEELLAAGERARAAQGEAVSGQGAGALREALRAARELQSELLSRAEVILSGEGRATGRPVTDRVTTDLQALAFSPSAAEAIRRGWLSADLDPPGFEVLAGLQLAAVPARKPEPRPAPPPPVREAPAKKPGKPAKPAKAEQTEANRKEKEARRREDEAVAAREREAAERRERVTKAEREVARAESEADFLRRKVEQAEHAVEKAEAAVEEARERAAEARQNASRARERSAEAEEALASAGKSLKEALKATGGVRR